MSGPPEALLRAFGATAPCPVAETAGATVWRVRLADGPAALKLYRRADMGNEGPGLGYLRDLGPDLAVGLRAVRGPAVLMDWLDGRSLGDELRGGAVQAADEALGGMARRLVRARTAAGGLTDLSDWVAALFALDVAPEAGDRARADIAWCRDTARDLLATAGETVALHGDLHHDNVLRTGDGLRVIDAKGLRGDAAFELANAFRNPKGAPPEVTSAAHLSWRADVWSAALGVGRARLLGWAAVKAALSLAWSTDGRLTAHAELPLLSRLVDLARAAG